MKESSVTCGFQSVFRESVNVSPNLGNRAAPLETVEAVLRSTAHMQQAKGAKTKKQLPCMKWQSPPASTALLLLTSLTELGHYCDFLHHHIYHLKLMPELCSAL